MERTCPGCEESRPLVEGMAVLASDPTQQPFVMECCAECWAIIDGADPITGSYGATATDVRRHRAAPGAAQ